MASKFGNTQDLVDIDEIRENTVILRDGSLRQVIMVGGMNFALKSELEQNVVTSSYQNFLNGIDFPLQIVVHSRKVNIERYLESLAGMGAKETSPLLVNQAEEYREFVRGFVQKNEIMEKSFFVIVPFYPLVTMPTQKGVSKILPFAKKDKAAEAKALEQSRRSFNENLDQLKQRVNQVIEGLIGIGLETALLNNEQLIELFYNFYNPETVEKKEVVAERE